MATTNQLYLAYRRVSSDEQTLSGLGLADQDQRLRAHVTAQGGQLLRVYTDAGLSGTLPPSKRPGLNQLLADADKLPAGSVVLVLRLDRLARSTLEALTIEGELRRRGLRLASVCDQIDAGSASGRAMLTMMFSYAELESSLTGERTHVAMRASISPGGARIGGAAPLGYRADDWGRFVVVPGEADVVRELVRRFLDLRSLAATARSLNADGLLGRAGRPWVHATVRVVLGNIETYGGVRMWSRTSRRSGPRDRRDWLVVPDCHEPLLQAEVVAAVLAVLRRREHRRQARRQRQLLAQDVA